MMPSVLIVIGPKEITPTDATRPCKILPNYACKSICVSPKKKRKPFKWHSNSKYNNWNVPTRNKKPPFVTWAKEVMPKLFKIESNRYRVRDPRRYTTRND